MHFKMASVKWWPFYLSLNVFNQLNHLAVQPCLWLIGERFTKHISYVYFLLFLWIDIFVLVVGEQGKSEGFDSCGGVAEKTQISHHRWTLLLIATTINKVLQSLLNFHRSVNKPSWFGKTTILVIFRSPDGRHEMKAIVPGIHYPFVLKWFDHQINDLP